MGLKALLSGLALCLPVARAFLPPCPHLTHKNARLPILLQAGGSLEDSIPAHYLESQTVEWMQAILDGYKEASGGEDLIEREGLTAREQAAKVAVLDVAVLSHDLLRNPADATYCYGNLSALKTFEYSWDEFVVLPSRYCVATKKEEDSRESSLSKARKKRESIEEVGTRVTKSGRLFDITAVVWNVLGEDGTVVGQAATCRVR
ncbi:unnamed protein product [Chrysoparadoxa australica]